MISTKTGIFKSIILSLSAVLVLCCNIAQAQPPDSDRYERVSLCQFMVTYPHKTYFIELEHEYMSIPLPNRMNDHSLGVNFIKFASDKTSAENRIDYFIKDAQIAKRLISRWFNHSKKNRTFSIELLRERGFYNANALDARLAKSLIRGENTLADNGERLINYTFVVVHDFKPLKNEFASRPKFNKGIKREKDEIIQLNDSVEKSRYNRQFHSSERQRKTYPIQCDSYLYRLKWNDEIASAFYSDYYTEIIDPDKIQKFDSDSSSFQLEFISMISNRIDQRRNRQIKSNEQLVKTAMARIMDLNISQLQNICPDFRVKSTLYIENGNLYSDIGLKEDVKPNDTYEVLERSENEDGTLQYTRIGTIRPVADEIWDNRFNAMDSDGYDEKGLLRTRFEKIDGDDFYTGLILRRMNN